MRKISKLAVAILASYLLIIAVFYCFQRDLIYFPKPAGQLTPSNYSVPYSEVYIAGQDGLKLNAWWIKQDQESKITPSVLYCHGNAATLSSLAHISAIFYELGWNVLIFDYRNYGKSDHSPAGLSEQALVADASAAYDWLLANSGHNSSQTLVWGHSLGAAVALQVALARSPAGLIMEGPFTSISDMARYRYPWLLFPDSLLLDKFNSFAQIKALKSRLLIMHAEKDSIIPLGLGKKLFENAPKPKQFLLIKNSDHNNFPDVYKNYVAQLRNFAAQALQD